MKNSSPLLLLLSGLLMIVTTAFGAERVEDPNEARVRDIAMSLRCAVCQNQPVYESNSELAQDMLGLIRDQVAQGQDSEEIRRYFFERYGDYIYLEPTMAGTNLILWVGPFVGLVLGILGLSVAIKRWRAAPPASEAPPEAPGPEGTANSEAAPGEAAGNGDEPPEAMRERIRKELERVEM